MPFKKVDPSEELKQLCKDDSEITKYVEDFNKDYDIKKRIS